MTNTKINSIKIISITETNDSSNENQWQEHVVLCGWDKSSSKKSQKLEDVIEAPTLSKRATTLKKAKYFLRIFPLSSLSHIHTHTTLSSVTCTLPGRTRINFRYCHATNLTYMRQVTQHTTWRNALALGTCQSRWSPTDTFDAAQDTQFF